MPRGFAREFGAERLILTLPRSSAEAVNGTKSRKARSQWDRIGHLRGESASCGGKKFFLVDAEA